MNRFGFICLLVVYLPSAGDYYTVIKIDCHLHQFQLEFIHFNLICIDFCVFVNWLLCLLLLLICVVRVVISGLR